jgi:hypothetical protein
LVDVLEEDIKKSFEILRKSNLKNFSNVLNTYLDDLFDITFNCEYDLEKQDQDDFVKFAIKIINEFIKHKKYEKEKILTLNIANLILAEFAFNKEVLKKDTYYFDEFNILTTIFLVFLLEESMDSDNKHLPSFYKNFIKEFIFDVDLFSMRKKVENQILIDEKFELQSPLFSLNYIFENLEDVEVEFNEETEKINHSATILFTVDSLF